MQSNPNPSAAPSTTAAATATATHAEFQISLTAAQKLLGSIQIPPQPLVVQAIVTERAKEDPNIDHIINLIMNDVGLSAAVLKTTNSPYYALRKKISSIQSAVSMLGMKNISTLVMGLALRKSVPVEGIERYWESAARSAELAGMLAKKLGLHLIEDAHLYTLFHDSAMPLLMQRFPTYRETMLAMANAPWDTVTQLEDKLHHTNHAIVGGLLANNWGLPEPIRTAIMLHHDLTVFDHNNLPRDVVTLIAIGHVAEHIEKAMSQEMTDCECEQFGEKSIAYLMMGKDELRDFSDMARDLYDL